MRKLDPTGLPERLSSHCVRLPLPDPFVPGVTSVFVLESPDSRHPWLLDAGADMAESTAALTAGLARLGLTPDDATGVVLSHTHLDHSGGLLRWKPARLLAHERAIAEMRNREPASSRGRAALHRMGVPPTVAEGLAPESEPVGGTPLAEVPVSDPVGGEEGPLPECEGWRWILAEGHAPGHLMLFHEADRLLLSADQFLLKWKSPLRISDPEEDSFGLYLSSLQGAIDLAPETVCSSHTVAVRPGLPFLEERRAGLLRQLGRTSEAVEAGARTAWEVVAVGERRPSDGLLILFLRERFAMLRHLAATGALARSMVDGVERFDPA
ncbi:MAG: MBL fold metallo-hydrolase [marine benthic group bacterium]|nr:MBL fold metallo-hydrolase [Gemmatimonadota bacterium]